MPRIEKVLRPVPQWPAQPACQRNSEAHLWPLHKLTWHVTVKHASQQPFAFAGANAQMSRQRPGEFDHAMIQKWRAGGERDAPPHAGDGFWKRVLVIERGGQRRGV